MYVVSEILLLNYCINNHWILQLGKKNSKIELKLIVSAVPYMLLGRTCLEERLCPNLEQFFG
jgi:hypothetical protein